MPPSQLCQKMSVIHLTKESHLEPHRFRISYEDAQKVLGEGAKQPINDEIEPVFSRSRVAIIGGGLSGIATAITCLERLKTDDLAIFEKHLNFGGTWWANTYPGAACDIPAIFYSYFKEAADNWSELQPPQYEMEEYVLRVVEKHQLAKYAHFCTQVTQVKYLDEHAEWQASVRDLKTGGLRVHTSKILVTCLGQIVFPQHLKAPGLENFKGDYIHLALWNHEVSFSGKKVVVVGNGCSACQVIPTLLRDYNPESIHQIVRSKHYVMPPLPTFVHKLYRLLSFSRIGIIVVRLIVALGAESRWPLYKGSSLLSRLARFIDTWRSVRYMRKNSPEKYHRLIIPDYKLGCKRPVFDHGYIQSLNDPRMDLSAEAIDHVAANGIVLKGGEFIPADIIVACTGYNVYRSFESYEIIGRNNTNVSALWKKEGVSAHSTFLVRDCPNMFMMAGPNASTGHSLVVLAIENGCAFFERVASRVLSGEYRSITVKTEKYYEWLAMLKRELKKSVFGTSFGGCVSWYSGGDDAVNAVTYPYSQVYYWWILRRPDYAAFEMDRGSEKVGRGSANTG